MEGGDRGRVVVMIIGSVLGWIKFSHSVYKLGILPPRRDRAFN